MGGGKERVAVSHPANRLEEAKEKVHLMGQLLPLFHLQVLHLAHISPEIASTLHWTQRTALPSHKNCDCPRIPAEKGGLALPAPVDLPSSFPEPHTRQSNFS